ncbi:MAG: DoxX family protein [Verrucomicrobia bacterium]|nr:MAG: DoxX family protein [Verrucomicrobiota bacterium]
MAQIEKVKFVWRIVDFVVAGLFIVAGLTKIFDLDHVIADLRHLRLGDLLIDLQSIRFADPAAFANDIDNYKILPWTIGVALAFYLPWLEIFCGIALIVRRLYLGGLSILTALVCVFTVATIAAKVRGLDITCGCFGHASKNWSFSGHMALDLAILAALLALYFKVGSGNRLQNAV